MDPADYVLRPFAGPERPVVARAVERAVRAIDCWLEGGIVAAMDEFNQPFLPAGAEVQEH
jgi:hypothetical protein